MRQGVSPRMSVLRICGRRVCPCKSLAVLHPAVLQYWDTGKNEPVDPFWLGVQSSREVWWRHECAEGRVRHWTAKIFHVVNCFRARGRVPCPGCAPAIRAVEFAERRAERIKRK